MTAEIAILNTGAIALAADSAVTWGNESTAKIYNTVNKLFTLSKYHPVGIMVFGNAELLGVPWESIIKVYRQKAGDRRFDHLDAYAKSFLDFLNDNVMLFPADAQRTHVGRVTHHYFLRIKADIDKRVREQTDGAATVTDEQVVAYAQEIIHDHLRGWEEAPLLPTIAAEDILAAIQEYDSVVNEAIAAVFEALQLPESTRADLHRLSANLFARTRYVVSPSGAVIAGFGELDMVPSLAEFTISGVTLGKLRFLPGRTHSALKGPSIMPFAQSEMVETFMEGVNPNFKKVVGTFLEKVLGDLPDALMTALAPHLATLDEPARAELKGKLGAACSVINNQLGARVKEYTLGQHVRPIIGAVSALPKEQLAEMAEALVNLTSFRQKVSGASETVGGPIGVAVISKGDGFVWIKRKHYFKPELNQHFFANYYRHEARSRTTAGSEGAAPDVPVI